MYSKDLINHVLSLKKPTKEVPTPGICFPLQRQLVISLLELMRMAEQEMHKLLITTGFLEMKILKVKWDLLNCVIARRQSLY